MFKKGDVVSYKYGLAPYPIGIFHEFSMGGVALIKFPDRERPSRCLINYLELVQVQNNDPLPLPD